MVDSTDFSDTLHGLYTATYQPGKGSHIWQFDGEIPKPLAHRNGRVGQLHVLNGELFDATEHEIRRTCDGNRLAYRNFHIHALSSHDGKLVDAGMEGIIRETESGKKLHHELKRITALLGGKRLLYATAIAIWHDSYLPDQVGTLAQIFALGQTVPLCTRDYEVVGISEFEGRYYDALDAPFIGKIGRSLVKPFAARSGRVTALTTHNGELIDAEHLRSQGTQASRIIRTAASDIVYQSPHEITAIATPSPDARSR